MNNIADIEGRRDWQAERVESTYEPVLTGDPAKIVAKPEDWLKEFTPPF